jgi:hypothetical protein
MDTQNYCFICTGISICSMCGVSTGGFEIRNEIYVGSDLCC